MAFVPFNRDFFNGALDMYFKEPRVFSKFEALSDLLQSARIENKKEFINGREIPLQKGDVPISRSYLEKRWQWKHTKIDNFLKFIQK